MKLVFASISFCLLLLPGVGRGQGIVVSKFANDNQLETSDNDHVFPDYFLPSQKFKYIDTAGILKKQKVKAIYVYDKHEKNNLLFSALFDTAGRMTHQKCIGKNKDRNIIIDSLFYPNKTIISKRYFKNPATLFGRDSIVVIKNKTRIKISTISFRSGSYLNERNKKYNRIDAQSIRCYVSYWKKNTMNSYYMYSGVQIEGNFDAYINKMADPPSEKFFTPTPLETNYNSSRFYRSQRQKTYLNKNGEIENVRKTFWTDKEGMEFDHKEIIFHSKNRKLENDERNIEIIRYMKQYVNRNPKGLPDTICNYTYPKENGNRCVKPKDPNCNFYLQGRSGIPIHTNIYTIRYEYFDE